MSLCKIDIEENADCKKCCLDCKNTCERKCVFAKFNNYENGIRCNNKIEGEVEQ
mgnify:CR=1 FL=1